MYRDLHRFAIGVNVGPDSLTGLVDVPAAWIGQQGPWHEQVNARMHLHEC